MDFFFVLCMPVIGVIRQEEKSQQPKKDGKDAKQPKRKCYKCTYCGPKHEKKKCPAFSKECTVCHKPHHFASVCKTKQMGSNMHSLADGNKNRQRLRCNSNRGFGAHTVDPCTNRCQVSKTNLPYTRCWPVSIR